jgi:hypothetical protein
MATRPGSPPPYSGDVFGGPEGHHSMRAGTTMSTRTTEVARAGITMGSALAITISWSVHHSILWAVIHGFFSWFYVVYYALTRA